MHQERAIEKSIKLLLKLWRKDDITLSHIFEYSILCNTSIFPDI